MAEKNNLTVIYSNINFDLWVLLHFERVSSFLSEKDINRKLAKYYGVESYRNEVKGEMVSKPLRDKVIIAYNNAISAFDKLDADASKSIECNPYVNIHNYLHEIYQIKKI